LIRFDLIVFPGAYDREEGAAKKALVEVSRRGDGQIPRREVPVSGSSVLRRRNGKFEVERARTDLPRSRVVVFYPERFARDTVGIEVGDVG
jgi:hypothetical protein